MNNDVKASQDPLHALREAIAKLNAYTDAQNSIEDKTDGLMKSFFRLLTNAKPPRNESEKEIIYVVKILQSHSSFIENLQNGNPQQQKFAQSLLAAIQRYNKTIEQARRHSSSIREKIRGYFAEKSGELLPQDLPKIVIQHRISPGDKSPSPKFAQVRQAFSWVSPFPQQEVPYLSRQALELFYMKAISLIEKEGLLNAADARSALGNAHVSCELSEEAKCTLTCRLADFLVQGVFKKVPHSELYTLPDINSFKILPGPHQPKESFSNLDD